MVVDFAVVRKPNVHLFLKFNVTTMSYVSDEMKRLVSDI